MSAFISVVVQNNKVMQSYAKLKKAIQQEGTVRFYRQKRYFMTRREKDIAAVSMRVMRANAFRAAQERNASGAL